jgi:hypothetical protein
MGGISQAAGGKLKKSKRAELKMGAEGKETRAHQDVDT